MKHATVRLPFLLTLFMVLAVSLSAQTTSGDNWSATFLRSLSIDSKASTFVLNNDYGNLGLVGVSFPLFSNLPSGLSGVVFGGELRLQGLVGAGTRHQVGNLSTSIDIEFFEVNARLPIFNLSNLLNLPNTVQVVASPSIGFPSMRNYATGNYNGVMTRGFGISLDAYITNTVSLSVEQRWVEMENKSFLWSTRYQTLSLGLSFNVGALMGENHTIARQNEELRARNRRIEESFSILRSEVTTLREENKSLKDKREVALELKGIKDEVQALRNEVTNPRSIQPSNTNVKEKNEGGSHLVPYDSNRLPRTKVIRVDKKIFDKSDLVEEDYVKGILAIINNYDGYAWEIAYRDALNKETIKGEELAMKIKNFFEIYNSNLSHKLRLVLDPSLLSEFEIRCLGLTLVDRSKAEAANRDQ